MQATQNPIATIGEIPIYGNPGNLTVPAEHHSAKFLLKDGRQVYYSHQRECLVYEADPDGICEELREIPLASASDLRPC